MKNKLNNSLLTDICFSLPQDVYQTAKISKLLLLMEKGETANYSGKTLEDIDVELYADAENGENNEGE